MLNTFFKLHKFKSPEQRKLFLRCMYKMQTFNLLQQDDQRSRQLRNNFIKVFLQNASKLSCEHFRILWTRTPFTFLIKFVFLIKNLFFEIFFKYLFLDRVGEGKK